MLVMGVTLGWGLTHDTVHVPEGWVDQLSYQGSSTEWASIAFSCMKNLFVQVAEFTLPLSLPWSSSVKRSPC